MKKIKSNMFFGNISPFLIPSFILILFIGIISLVVGEFMIEKLTELTTNSFLDKQEILASTIQNHLVTMPNLLAKNIRINNDEYSDSYLEALIKRLKSSLDYTRSIWFATFDEQGNVLKVLSDFSYKEVPKEMFEFEKTDKIVFNTDSILSVGVPYRDSMGLATVLPVYVIYYQGLIPKAILFIEFDFSSLFFDIYETNLLQNQFYSVDIFSNQNTLLESSFNYRIQKVAVPSVLLEDQVLLSREEMRQLKTNSMFYKSSDEIIDLYSINSIGFIVHGQLPFSYIHSAIRPVFMVIISVGATAVLILLLLSGMYVHSKKMKETEIKLQLETIQAKLDPHFLFNTLNSMVGLAIDGDNSKLIEAFKSLSIFLRSSIKTSFFVSLFDEMEFIQSYVEIQKIRFEGMFDFSFEIEDESLFQVMIPRFTLQPLIENCFVHSIVPGNSDFVSIKLKVTSSKGELIIEIENNGLVSDEDRVKVQAILDGNKQIVIKDHGIGISIINKELKILYGKRYGLEVVNLANQNTFNMRIKLPLKKLNRS